MSIEHISGSEVMPLTSFAKAPICSVVVYCVNETHVRRNWRMMNNEQNLHRVIFFINKKPTIRWDGRNATLRKRCQYSLINLKTPLTIHYILHMHSRENGKVGSVGNPAIDGRSCFCKNWPTGKVRRTQQLVSVAPLKFRPKFCYPHLNRFGEIRPEAVGYGIFGRLFELREMPIGSS